MFMKFLEENNFHLERVKGSHHIMDNGSVSVSVPVHGNSDIAKGTLASILKDSGLTGKFRSVYGKIK
jgi:predicted RNA binding protein YcfA (HicA-like mRNA interferase family)